MNQLFEMLAASKLKKSYNEVVITTVCLTILGTIGVIGNGMVIYIYTVKFQKNSSNIFIMFLAVIDFLICLIMIPYTLVKEWQTEFTSDIVCRLLEGIQGSMMPMSTLVLVAIAVERFCLIYFMPSIVTTPTQAAIAIIFIILFGICLGIPTALSVSVYVYSDADGTVTYDYLGFCQKNKKFLSMAALDAYWAVVASFFGLMMLTIIVLYSTIFISVYKRSYLFHKKLQQKAHPAKVNDEVKTSDTKQHTKKLKESPVVQSTLNVPASANRTISPPFMARKVAPRESPTDSLFKELSSNTLKDGSEIRIHRSGSSGDLFKGDHCKSEESFISNQNQQHKDDDTMVKENKLSTSALNDADEGVQNINVTCIPEISIHSQARRATIVMDTNEGDVMALTTIGDHSHQEVVIKQDDLGVVVKEIDEIHSICSDMEESSTEAVISSPVNCHEGKNRKSETPCSEHSLGRDNQEVSNSNKSQPEPGMSSATASTKPNGSPSESIPVKISLIPNSRPQPGSLSKLCDRSPSDTGSISVISNNVPMLETTLTQESSPTISKTGATKTVCEVKSTLSVSSRPTSADKPDNSRPTNGQKGKKGRPHSGQKIRSPHILTAKILAIVTLTFIVSYLPMILMMNHLIPSSRVIYIFFINNAANPIIYSSMNKKFQEKLKEEVRRVTNACKRCKRA